MKSVNLDIWSTQTMSYEVSQFGYLINTNNVLWSQSTWISDQHKKCPMKSVNLETLFVLNRYLSWMTSYDIVYVAQIFKLTDFIGHFLCWSDIQVDWLHRTLFWISDQHKQCLMKSVNLDIWSTQTMFYEVSQLGYLINTKNVLWSQSTWISDQHKQCPMKLIRYPSWLTS
jgi:hypothetical protein